MRENNLTVHNISEELVSTKSCSLKDDRKKLDLIIRTAIKLVSKAVKLCPCMQRIGRRSPDNKGQPRPLRVSLKQKEEKYQLLNCRKATANDPSLKEVFRNKSLSMLIAPS